MQKIINTIIYRIKQLKQVAKSPTIKQNKLVREKVQRQKENI